jgi:hypothetical protein
MANRRMPAALVLTLSLAAGPALAAPPEAPKSPDPTNTRTLLERGRERARLAVFDEAASAFEGFARASPAEEGAPDALEEAIVLRLGLGQVDEATRDAELYEKQYGRARAASAARLWIAIADHLAGHGDDRTAKKLLASKMALVDRAAPLDERLRAHALLGRILLGAGDRKAAESEYTAVRGLWKDPGASVKKIQDETGGDDRKIVKALTAVGEALFFFAEQKRKDVEKIRFPEYKGSGSREDVLKHVGTKVGDWVKKKRPAIEETEKEYLKILDLQPFPPPRWVIAAGSRVGQMWGKFVAEFRAAPIPKEWKGHGLVPGGSGDTYAEIRSYYYGALDEASEPLKQRAKAAYSTCLSLSAKYQYADPYSRACLQWLARSYPHQYLPIDEFAPGPVLLTVGALPRPASGSDP